MSPADGGGSRDQSHPHHRGHLDAVNRPARADSLAFLVGRIVVSALATCVLIAIASTQDLSAGGEPSDTVSWIKLILGVLLILYAVKEWRSRQSPGSEPSMPAWMGKVDSMTPAAALRLALILSVANRRTCC